MKHEDECEKYKTARNKEFLVLEGKIHIINYVWHCMEISHCPFCGSLLE